MDAELARKLAAVAPVIARLPQPTRARIGAKIVAGHMQHGETIRQIPPSEPESKVWDLLAYTAMLCEDVGIPRSHELRSLVEHLLGRLLPAVEDLMGSVASRRKQLEAQEVRKAAKQAEGREKPAKAEKPRESGVQRNAAGHVRNGVHKLGTMTGTDARALREKLGLTQREMGALIGAHRKAVGKAELTGNAPLTLLMETRYRTIEK